MKITKANIWKHLPEDYTGIIEWSNRIKGWFKNGVVHLLPKPQKLDGITVPHPVANMIVTFEVLDHIS